jgi:hypothetical protein
MGLGFNIEPGIEKPLILAAARAQHHPVLSQPNGRDIGVGRHMIDRQYRHSLSMRSTPAARAVCERVIARAVGGVSKPLSRLGASSPVLSPRTRGPFRSSASKRALPMLQPHANLIGGKHWIFRPVDDPDDVACRRQRFLGFA